MLDDMDVLDAAMEDEPRTYMRESTSTLAWPGVTKARSHTGRPLRGLSSEKPAKDERTLCLSSSLQACEEETIKVPGCIILMQVRDPCRQGRAG